MPPPLQWAEAGKRAGNIALRAGNGLAVADADSPQTVETLSRVLAGLGLKPPIVETPSGGRHYYLKLADAPPGRSVHHWLPGVGDGELRFGPGALVTAPPSAIGARRYRFLPGTAPEDWLSLPALRWRDVAGLLRPSRNAQPIDTLPVPLPRRELAEWAIWLLNALAALPPGRPVRVGRKGVVIEYASRSEAEQAVILHAVWRGWSLADVAALFEQYEPGHYASRADRDGYLRTCWRNALNLLAGTPTRQTIAELWRWACSRPWPGRGGASELALYQGLLQRGFMADTLSPDFSIRDAELFASMSRQGAYNTLRRLARLGLISRAKPRHKATDACAWELATDVLKEHNSTGLTNTTDALPGDAEIWAILGRATGLVYRRLNHDPQSVMVLAVATGKHRNTVRRALSTLASYGMAARTPKGWVIGEHLAADIAQAVGAPLAKRRRQRRIEMEREAFHETLWRTRSIMRKG